MRRQSVSLQHPEVCRGCCVAWKTGLRRARGRFSFPFFNPDLSKRGEEWRNESGNPESEGGRLKERVNRQENSVEKCGGV